MFSGIYLREEKKKKRKLKEAQNSEPSEPINQFAKTNMYETLPLVRKYQGRKVLTLKIAYE